MSKRDWLPKKRATDYTVSSLLMNEDGSFTEKEILVSSIDGLTKDEEDIIIFPDYSRDSVIVDEQRNNDLYSFVEACVEYGRNVVILCERVAHVFYLLGFIKKKESNLSVKTIIGKNKVSERNKVKDEFAEGKINILIASSIFDEGEDIKNVGAVALAGCGCSLVRQVQRIGRGVRRKSDMKNICPVWFPVDTKNKYSKSHSLQRLEFLDKSEVSSVLAKDTKTWKEILSEFL